MWTWMLRLKTWQSHVSLPQNVVHHHNTTRAQQLKSCFIIQVILGLVCVNEDQIKTLGTRIFECEAYALRFEELSLSVHTTDWSS